MEPAIRLELITYRLQGGCSTDWAMLANNLEKDYLDALSKATAILCFFLPQFFFFNTPTFTHLSIYLYIVLTCSWFTVSPFSIAFLNFLITIFILSLKSKFLWRNTKDLFADFFADFVIGILKFKFKYLKQTSSPGEGLEPTTQWLTVICSTDWAIPDWITFWYIMILKHISILFLSFFYFSIQK